MPSFLEIIANGLAVNTSLNGHGFPNLPQKIDDLQDCPLGLDGDVSPDLGVSYDAYESEGSMVLFPHSQVDEQGVDRAGDQAWQTLVTSTRGLLDTDRNSTQAARHFFACQYFGKLVVSQQSMALQPDEGNSEKSQKGLGWGLEHFLERMDPELVPIVSYFLSKEHVYVGQPKLEGAKTVYSVSVDQSSTRREASTEMLESGILADYGWAEALDESMYRAMKPSLLQLLMADWDDNTKHALKQQLGMVLSQIAAYVPFMIGIVDVVLTGVTWASGYFIGEAATFKDILKNGYPKYIKNFDNWDRSEKIAAVTEAREAYKNRNKSQPSLKDPKKFMDHLFKKEDPNFFQKLIKYDKRIAGLPQTARMGIWKDIWQSLKKNPFRSGVTALAVASGGFFLVRSQLRDWRIEKRMAREGLEDWETDRYDVATIEIKDRPDFKVPEIPYKEYLVNGQVDNREIKFAQAALSVDKNLKAEIQKAKLPEKERLTVTLVPKAKHALCKDKPDDPRFHCRDNPQTVPFDAHIEDGKVKLDRPSAPELDNLDKAWASRGVIIDNPKYSEGVFQYGAIRTASVNDPKSKRAAFLVSLHESDSLAELRQKLEALPIFSSKVDEVRKRLEEVKEGGRMSFDINRADLVRAKRIFNRNIRPNTVRDAYVAKNRWANWANDPQADHGKFLDRAVTGAENVPDNSLTAKELEAVRLRILAETVGLRKYGEMLEHEKERDYPKEAFFNEMLDYFAVREILNDCHAEQARSVKSKKTTKS